MTYYLGIFTCILSSAGVIFSKPNFFKKLFSEYHQSVRPFESRSGPTFVPDLGPNCLHIVSADDASR